MLTAVILVLGSFFSEGVFPKCAIAEMRLEAVDETPQIAVKAVRFSQDEGRSNGVVLIRNNGPKEIMGVLVQVELLDGAGNFMHGFRALASLSVDAVSERKQLREEFAPLTTSSLVLRSINWNEALTAEKERLIPGELVVLLPSCPLAAKATVFAISDNTGRWHRRQHAQVLRQSSLPQRISESVSEVRNAWEHLGAFGDVAVLVSVSDQGSLKVLRVIPELSVEQREKVELLLRTWRFSPAVDQQGSQAEELLILLRFQKSGPLLPTHILSGLPPRPLVVAVVEPNSITIPVWGSY